MVHFLQPLVFGIVQGLTEFLPVSSTAHLTLLPFFTGWQDPGLAFDVALHIGTLVAVIAFFWKDWLNIFSSALTGYKKEGLEGFKKEALYFLIIATIPGAFFGILFEKKAETVFRSPLLIAITLIVVGAILYWADKKHQGVRKLKDVGLKDALVVGFSQALAVIPGFSRSGTTIAAGLYRGLDKISAARFSFLLSTPIIMGAAIVELPRLIRSGIDSAVIIGIISSMIFGYLSIKYMLKFLEKYGYAIFFWYRLLLGLVVIAVYFLLR